MSERYMVMFLSEERDPVGGGRRLALPHHRREEEYEERLEAFVREKYPALFVFADRHQTGLDFMRKSSAVILTIRDEDTLALLKLGFESEVCKVHNYDKFVARERERYQQRKLEEQRAEYDRVKARYFELKAILEPDDDSV